MKTTLLSLEEFATLLETAPSTNPDKTIAGIWHTRFIHPELGETIAIQGSGDKVLLVHQ
jgi:hypothetical protein